MNLRGEVEIRMINERLDHLIHHHWQHMLEIQGFQTEMVEDLHLKLFRRPALWLRSALSRAGRPGFR